MGNSCTNSRPALVPPSMEPPPSASPTTTSTGRALPATPAPTRPEEPRSYTNHRAPPPSEPILEPNHPEFTPSANARNRYTVDHIYEMGEEPLGQGAFGTVYRSRHRQAAETRPWSTVAIKRARPSSTDLARGPIWSLDHLETQCNEIITLRHLQQQPPPPGSSSSSSQQQQQRVVGVVRLYEYFLAVNDYYIVTELLGMDMEEYKTSSEEVAENFNEATVREMSRTILRALMYMHSKGVVHRDLKMQNILFAKNGEVSSLKIIDFGLAKILGPEEQAHEFCGTNGYMAPEIYAGRGYRFEVDLFSFGVLLFRLLSDERPFPVGNTEVLKRSTMELRYQVNGADWEMVSPLGKDMVRKLLINREQRLTAAQALRHPWMNDPSHSRLRVQGTLTRAYQAGARRSRSRNAILEPPLEHQRSITLGVSRKYWIDMSMRQAIEMLMFTGTFSAELVDEQTGTDGEEGRICCREKPPPNAKTLAMHIAGFDRYTERNCRDLFKSVVQRVEILHGSSVAHRNLHPDNVLVEPDNNVTLKGLHFSQLIRPDRPLTGHFGHLYSWYAFKAPEIDQRFAHDRSVDVWSLGGILYMMLTGLPPFRGDALDLVDVKHAGIFDFEPVPPSGGAQRLTRKLLNIMPEERYTINDILHDPWIEAESDYLEQFDLDFARVTNQMW